jgi:hypothetical protein
MNATTTNRTLSGRWVVVVLIAFGMLATGGMWVYWKLHVAPFLPLQQALADEFDDSSPRVEGGQRKIHKGTPRILRITLKVDFDPAADAQRADAFADRVVRFTRGVYDLTAYEVLEVHLYWPEPEGEIKMHSITRPVAELPDGEYRR